MKRKSGYLTASKSKYRNKRVNYSGINFDSMGERDRFIYLCEMEKNGIIENLSIQQKYILAIRDVKICQYVADFVYTKSGQIVVEDFKSKITEKLATFRIKKNLMKAIHGIDIKIVKMPTERV